MSDYINETKSTNQSISKQAIPHKHDTYVKEIVRYLGESLEMKDLPEIIRDYRHTGILGPWTLDTGLAIDSRR